MPNTSSEAITTNRQADVRPPLSVGHLARACLHERSHINDSKFLGGGYASVISRQIFCDTCRLQRWLDVEVALAQAEVEVGIIPASAAREITRAPKLSDLDLDSIAVGIRKSGQSIVVLLRVLQGACRDGAGEFVHFGATTQDIQDTGDLVVIGHSGAYGVSAAPINFLGHPHPHEYFLNPPDKEELP